MLGEALPSAKHRTAAIPPPTARGGSVSPDCVREHAGEVEPASKMLPNTLPSRTRAQAYTARLTTPLNRSLRRLYTLAAYGVSMDISIAW